MTRSISAAAWSSRKRAGAPRSRSGAGVRPRISPMRSRSWRRSAPDSSAAPILTSTAATSDRSSSAHLDDLETPAADEDPMPKTPDYFHGKTIVITGAASGIGRATALTFGREGANVVCADLNLDGARKTAEQVTAAGRKALALGVDVTSRQQVDTMVRQAIDAFGSVQFLFNSAGAALRRAKFLDIDDALLEKTFALNLKGTFYCMQAVLPHMQQNRHGVIVNMASMAHRRGGPGTSVHYAAAKGAVVSMTLGVAREFAHLGIRALSISPGPIRTPFQAAAQTSPEVMQRFLDDVPMGRFGEPEEIGELVLFMCSDACAFMTADTVYVNGGGGGR